MSKVFRIRKKAMLFSITLVLIFVIVSITAFILLDKKYRELSANRQIGEKQLELITAYSHGEKAMFYIDKAAELAAEETLYELAQENLLSDCGNIYDNLVEGRDSYAVWQVDGKKCFSLDKVKDAFESHFNAKMYSYLYAYPEKNVRMPSSFEISLNGSLDIIGTATTDLIVGLPSEKALFSMGGFFSNIGIQDSTPDVQYFFQKIQEDKSRSCVGRPNYCAGFISHLFSIAFSDYSNFGIKGDAWDMAANFIKLGRVVWKIGDEADPFTVLRPGDIVFFRSPTTVRKWSSRYCVEGPRGPDITTCTYNRYGIVVPDYPLITHVTLYAGDGYLYDQWGPNTYCPEKVLSQRIQGTGGIVLIARPDYEKMKKLG